LMYLMIYRIIDSGVSCSTYHCWRAFLNRGSNWPVCGRT
jgi:hypothetical protein